MKVAIVFQAGKANYSYNVLFAALDFEHDDLTCSAGITQRFADIKLLSLVTDASAAVNNDDDSFVLQLISLLDCRD